MFLHIEALGDAESKFKRIQNIQQIILFKKRAKIHKKSMLLHFLTVHVYTAVRLHNVLHIEAFGGAEPKFKRKQNIQLNISFKTKG